MRFPTTFKRRVNYCGGPLFLGGSLHFSLSRYENNDIQKKLPPPCVAAEVSSCAVVSCVVTGDSPGVVTTVPSDVVVAVVVSSGMLIYEDAVKNSSAPSSESRI